jgi:hypothetical protein
MLEFLASPVGLWLLVGLVLLVIALGWALALLSPAIVGAIVIFHYASEWRFLGIAAYAACWFFMFPLMLVGSLAVGLFVLWTDRQAEKRRNEPLRSLKRARQTTGTPRPMNGRGDSELCGARSSASLLALSRSQLPRRLRLPQTTIYMQRFVWAWPGPRSLIYAATPFFVSRRQDPRARVTRNGTQ